jgi:hypothetical protein
MKARRRPLRWRPERIGVVVVNEEDSDMLGLQRCDPSSLIQHGRFN